jgi:hypothetical protein
MDHNAGISICPESPNPTRGERPMKLTLELDNGWKHAIEVADLVPSLEDLEGMVTLMDSWHEAMKAEANGKG